MSREHYTLSTVSVSAWCGKCQKDTQHRVDGRRKGPCLDCIERLERKHAENFLTERLQAELFQNV